MNNANNTPLGFNVAPGPFAAFDGRPELEGMVFRCATLATARAKADELTARHGYEWDISTILIPS